MRIGGSWVGLGLGDSSDEIQKIKAFLRKKFSYARHLADTPDFDQQMFDVVFEMQSRYHAQGQLHAPTGIIDLATKIKSGYLQPQEPADSRPMLFTVCGTGVPWWVGPDADVARAVGDQWKWQPVGYPAAPFPMNTSAQQGRDELVRLFELHRLRIEKHGAAMIGYSQGAIVTSELWQQDLLPDNGRLRWARSSMLKAITFGNPMRQAGSVYADSGGPPASATSRGIADTLLTDTPSWWRDYAHAGDLYTAVEGQSAEWSTAIYKVVMGARVFQGPDSILAQILELTAAPAAEAIAIFQALLNAGLFFVRRTGPHLNYHPQAAIEYLRSA